jgi:hypothetical protein
MGVITHRDEAQAYQELPEFPMLPEFPWTPRFPELPENPEFPELPENPELPESPENPEFPVFPEFWVLLPLPEFPEFWVVGVVPAPEFPVDPEPVGGAVKSPRMYQVPLSLTSWAVALAPVKWAQYDAPAQVIVAVAWLPLGETTTEASVIFGNDAEVVWLRSASLQLARSEGSASAHRLDQFPVCRSLMAPDAVVWALLLDEPARRTTAATIAMMTTPATANVTGFRHRGRAFGCDERYWGGVFEA